MGLYDLILPIAESAIGSAALGAALWVLSGRFHVAVPPNQALVLFGGHHSLSTPDSRGRSGEVVVRRARIIVGGRALVAPWNRAVGHLSLEPVVTDLTVRAVQSLEGTHAAGWEVRLRVATKIPTEPGLLATAAENLLGKDDEEVRRIVRQAVEGVVPTVLARLRASVAEPDWERLAAEVQATVAPDLVTWGLTVRSLSVTELHRIVPATPSATANESLPAPAVTPDAGAIAVARLFQRLDARLAAAERNLATLATETVRTRPDRPALGDGSQILSVLDLPLGYGTVEWETPDGGTPAGIDDSTEGGAPPRPTRAAYEPRAIAEGRGLRPTVE